MTETVLPKEVVEKTKPEFVAPLVAYLAHESCPESGGLFEVGAGYVAKLRWNRSGGVVFDPVETLTPESLSTKWEEVVDFNKNPTFPNSS